MRRETTDSAEGRYRELVESAQVVFWQSNLQLSRFAFVSQEAERLLGYSTACWVDEPNFWSRHVYPEDQPLLAEHCRLLLEGAPAVPVEHRMVAQNGSLVWVRTAMRLVQKPSEPAEWVGLTFDICQRKQVEEALDNQRRLFEALMEASPELIYFKDLDSRFVRVNSAQARLFHLADPSSAIGKTDADFFSPAHAAKAFADEQEIIRTGKPLIDCEEHVTWSDGRVDWMSSTKMPLRNARDEICGTMGVSRDITERKLAQQDLQQRTQELLLANAELTRQILERRLLEGQLVQAQKLESIGQLAAGIAHEINTPIQYVGYNCRFVADSFQQIGSVLRLYALLLEQAKQIRTAPGLTARLEKLMIDVDLAYLLNEIPSALEQCNEGVERVAHIVRAMNEFSHPGSCNMEAIDLNHSIESTLTVCVNEYKYIAEVTTDLDPDLPFVRCLASEINQVILNIVVNAAHAIADAGRVGLGTITVSTRLDGDTVEIRVRDNGTGIPEEARSRIYDPFFTTKEVGRGSGQGLAIARNVIVKKHGGTLEFETAVNEGTVFIIRLPVDGQGADPLEPEDSDADFDCEEEGSLAG